MNTQQTETTNVEDISVEELEALMAGFDDDIVEAPVDEGDKIEGAEVLSMKSIDDEIESGEVEESLLAKALKEIASDEMAAEVYAEQESSDDHIEKSEKEVKPAAAKKVKTATPRKTTFTHSKDELVNDKAKPDFYLLEKSDLELDEDGRKAKHEAVNAMIKAMNVKISAKCVNMMAALNGNGKMSTFIESGFRYIVGADTISNADMVAYFMSSTRNGVKAYGKGTATPQATNLLKLFTELKMLNKVGSTYEINENSLLIESFNALRSTK